MRIHESLVEDLQGFARLWERICEDLQDFGRVFVWIHKALEEDSQGLKNILKIIYCCFLKPFYHFLFDFNFGCLLGVTYPTNPKLKPILSWFYTCEIFFQYISYL